MTASKKRTALKLAALTLTGVILMSISFLYWASRPNLPAQSSIPIDVGDWASAPSDTPEELRVVGLNLHFGVGMADDSKRLPDRVTVLANLEKLARLLEKQRADVVLLQEIDFGANRSHRIDMPRTIARLAGLKYIARARNWDKNYLPFPYWPPSAHWGRMISGHAVLSRYPLTSNRMLLFPKPAENAFWYNLFYIDRGVQIVDLQWGKRSVRLFNVHLEAYHKKTREVQAGLLAAVVKANNRPLMIIQGDLNATPPEATKKHNFVDAPQEDNRADQTIEILRKGLVSMNFTELLGHPSKRSEKLSFSYPALKPSRRLDYLYHSGLKLVTGRVLQDAGPISDHLPVFGVYRLPKTP